LNMIEDFNRQGFLFATQFLIILGRRWS
jgi:hypothetical protein